MYPKGSIGIIRQGPDWEFVRNRIKIAQVRLSPKPQTPGELLAPLLIGWQPQPLQSGGGGAEFMGNLRP